MPTNAKSDFEALIKYQQADLKRWIDSGKANQRGINIKTDIINKMIEFYNQAEALEQELVKMQQLYSNLRDGTQKLVYWCCIHRANPKAVALYDTAELKAMAQQGKQFGRQADLDYDDDNPLINKLNTDYLFKRYQCWRKPPYTPLTIPKQQSG